MKRTICALLSGAACAWLLSAPALAQRIVYDEEEAAEARAERRLGDDDRTARERTNAIEDDLRRLGLSRAEVSDLEREIESYVEAGGTPRHFVSLLDDAWEAGCREGCLEETARALNDAIEDGVSPARAAEIVRIAIEQEARTGGQRGLKDEDFGEAVRERVGDRVDRLEQRRDPDLEEERERRRRTLERQLGLERGDEAETSRETTRTRERRRELEDRREALERELRDVERELDAL